MLGRYSVGASSVGPTIRPSADDMISGSPRARTWVVFRVQYFPAFVVIAITLCFPKVVLIVGGAAQAWSQRPVTSTVILISPFLSVCAVYLVSRVFFPQTYVEEVTAESLGVGDWLVIGGRGRFAVVVTQVVAKFVNYDKEEEPIWIAYRNGGGCWAARGKELKRAHLTDMYSRFRMRKAASVKSENLFSDISVVIRELWDVTPPEVAGKIGQNRLRELLPECDEASREAVVEAAESLGLLKRYRVRGGPIYQITIAGQIWLAQVSRSQGSEIIADAQRRIPVTVENNGIYIAGGNIQGSNLSAGKGNVVQQNGVASDSDIEVVRSLLRLLHSQDARGGISDKGKAEFDDAVKTLEEAESNGEVRSPASRNALRSIARLSGDLILGAGGNALWEGVKALIN